MRRRSRILDECLDKIWAGQSTVDACLRQFPDDAGRLAPVLTLAVEARDHLAPSKPKPSFVGTSRRRVLLDVALRLYNSTLPQPSAKPAWRWQPAYVFISLMLAIVITATSTGVVFAANAALPGDALYGLKRGIERARLAVTWSASGDMRLLAEFADTRLAELEALLAANRYGDLDLALEGFDEAMSSLTGLAGETPSGLDPGSMEHILERLAHHQEVLAQVIDRVPDSAQAGIALAMEQSSHSQDVIQQLHQGGHAGDLPPGQEQTPPGQELTPPGQERTPPGQERTPPGQERTPPGQERRPKVGGTPMVMLTPTPTPLPPTPIPTEEPTMHVRDIDAQIVGGPNNRQVWVTISIATDSGGNVGGATVMGSWTASGEGAEYSCVTLASGKCTIRSGIILGVEETTFTVTSVTHASYPYAPEDNSDPDGDSNGTTITIELPN